MSLEHPICCRPQAFALLRGQLPRLSRHRALLNAAIAIARQIDPAADARQTRRTLDELAMKLCARVQGQQPQAMLAHLHELLFEEEGFAGNHDDYYHPDNSCLPRVLETRRGLPIMLGLIYCEVARRVGLEAWGVGLPGHFVCAVRADGEPALVDVFHGGRLIDHDEARELIRRRHPEMSFDPSMLGPFPHQHWVSRMLQNLLGSFSARGEFEQVAAVIEMQMLLWPGEARLQRDLALVLARIGKTDAAQTWLGRYLGENPHDPQQADLRQLLEALTAG